MSRYLELVDQGYRPEDLYNWTTLRVVFMDGAVVNYPRTRYMAGHKSLGLVDPIVVTGTTVEIENDEKSFTLLGVRSFTMEF